MFLSHGRKDKQHLNYRNKNSFHRKLGPEDAARSASAKSKSSAVGAKYL